VKIDAVKALDATRRLALEAVLTQAADDAEKQSIRDALNALKT